MGSISVSLKVLEEKEEVLTRMSRRVGSIESEFAAIRNSLDWDVRNENGIDQDMQKILDRLRGIEAGLRNAGVFLQDTKKAYETAEEKLKQSYSRMGEGYKYRVVINTDIWDKLLKNEKVREYLWNSGKQIVLGNFTDEVTLLGTAGQIVLGFTGLDVVGDIRDLTADIVKWKWSWSHIGQTLIDIVALVPVIGLVKYGDEAIEVIKSGLKNGGKLIEEGSEIAAKYWDEVSKVIEKHWEEACAVIRKNGEELIKALKKYGEEVAEAVSGKWNKLIERINSYWGEAMKNLEKFRDEFAETFKRYWEQVAASGSKATDEMIKEVSGKWDEFAGAVKQTWDKASEQGTKLLDEAMGIVGKEKDEITKLVTCSWNNTCEAVGKYWDNVAATLGGYWKGSLKLRNVANSSEELLEIEIKYGDEVAETAGNTIEKGINSTQKLLKETTCSSDDLANYLRNLDVQNAKRGITTNYADDFSKTDNWPLAEEAQIPKNSSVLKKDGSGQIDWGQVPCDGYITKTVEEYDVLSGKLVKKKVAIKEEYNPQIGEIIDRFGPSNGRYSSPTKDGIYPYEKRSLPYIEDAAKYHQYIVKSDFNFLKEAIEKCNDSYIKNYIDDLVIRYYDGDYSTFYKNLKTYKGEIASGFGSTGGGIQYELPISIELLEKLGFLEEIK